MSGTNNPYGSSYGGQMSGNAQYSGELNGASSGHIKDTTTAAFSRMFSRNRATSRFWWISGHRGAARASS